MLKIVVLGKAQADIKQAQEVARGALVVSANYAYTFYDLKPDVVVWQDRAVKVFDALAVTTDIKYNEQSHLWNYKEWQRFKKTAKPTEKEDELCFYPYTGVAALHWAVRQKPQEINVFGYSFGLMHDYQNGESYAREQYTNNCYKSNILIIKCMAEMQGTSIIWH
jgi:hypothetical protein